MEQVKGRKQISLTAMTTLMVVGMVAFIMLWGIIFFVSVYQTSMEQNAITSSEQAVVQVSNTVGNYTEDMMEIMSLIQNSYRLEQKEQKEQLERLMQVRQDLVGIYIYDENKQMLDYYTNGYTLKKNYLKNLSYVESDTYDTYQRGALYVSEPHVESLLENYYPWVVSILQKIELDDGVEHRVVIDIRFSKIANFVDAVGIGQHGYCYITDMDGNIIYHPQQQVIFSGLKKEKSEDIVKKADGSYKESEVIYAIKTLYNCRWRVVGVSYVNELVTGKVISVFKIVGIILGVLLVVALLSSYLLSRMISRPVERLMNAMGEFEKNAVLYEHGEIGGTREIQVLSQSFDHMVLRIQELMTKVRNEEIALRKTELKALQAQINPHFLYNTLDAIGWMCEEERSADAVEMVNALAKLFRISISKGHELITIAKEVEHAKSYLKIENYRYKNQFTYSFHVEEDCLPYYCNKITLQPIIENAIYHGLNRMVDEGRIDIRIYSQGDDIYMVVEDNGVGMTEEQCRSILNKEPGDNNGIGIKNVNDRIKIYFGDNYGLEIISEPDEGTKVVICMPKIEREASWSGGSV